jgi:hypothetical protein
MKFAERLRPLKIDAFIGQEFIVEVVFDFLHFGGNVDFVDELNRILRADYVVRYSKVLGPESHAQPSR